MRPYSKAVPSDKNARDIVDKLNDIDFEGMMANPQGTQVLEGDGRLWLTTEIVDKIIEAFNGHGEAFWLIDNKPGQYTCVDKDGKLANLYHSGWYHLLRRIRNHPIYGKKLFDSFR